MRVPRTRVLVAMLGAALLVTSVGPAGVLAAKSADKGNPHATPAPEPTADPSLEPTSDPTPEPTAAPDETPGEAPAADPSTPPADETPAPASKPTPGTGRATTDGDVQPEVAATTTLDLVVTPGTIAAGDTVTLTATVTPTPSAGCGGVTFTYDGTPSSEIALDESGVASTTVTAVAGLMDATAAFSGCAEFAASSDGAPVDARTASGTVALESDRTTAVQHEQSVTLTATIAPTDATGTITFSRDVSGTPQTLGTATLSGGSAVLVRSDLPVGTYDVYATYGGDATYKPAGAGNVVALTISGDTSVKTSSLAVQYSRFYPKKDGYRDTDKISGKTLEPATVTIRIYTSGGSRIKTFSLGTKNGSYSATWDGRRKDGSLFAQGTYTVKQSFKDARGNTKTVNQSIVLSHKKLYWTTSSQTRYADTGAFAYDGDGGAFHSKTWSHGVVLIGGSSGYAAARYTFTIPSATVYSSLRAAVYGKSMSGYGKGYIGIRNYANDNLDAFKYVGYSTDWYSNSVSASGHVTSDRKVQLWAFADSGNFGGVNYLKVKLTYRYAVLKY
jgi:hypothetical protein